VSDDATAVRCPDVPLRSGAQRGGYEGRMPCGSACQPLADAVRPPRVIPACRRSLPLCTATSDRDLIPAASRLGWIVDIKSEMRTMAQGVVQRQREAAVRRSRARRRARRQQIARKVLRYGVGTAAAVGAAVGATKLGGVE
jgi:hypothetical protein